MVSGEPEALTGRLVGLVPTRVDGSAAQSIGLSLQRWPAATVEPDGTGPLGGDDDRLRSAEASGTSGGLGFVADAWWHRTCLPALPERTPGLLHTRRDAWRPPGRARLQTMWGFVPDQWSRGATVAPVVAP
jgi:hypothetical protein